MSKTGYIGVDGTARKIKKVYVGVDGVAREVKSAYIGVADVARQWYTSEVVLIDFYIRGPMTFPLQAVQGQTFKQWINSPYNTMGAYDTGYAVEVIINGFPYDVAKDDIFVSPDDVIIADYFYNLVSVG